MCRRLFGLALGLAVAFPLFLFNPTFGVADGRHGHRHDGHYRHWGHDWWRSGYWYHGRHTGYFGWWWVIGPSWYYYPAPVYPYPPEIAVLPAPQVVTPAPAPAKPYCREFQGDAIINGSNQRFYGTACLMPDGSWHIVK